MKVAQSGPSEFAVEFETDEELRREYGANLSVRGLCLRTSAPLALHARVSVTLRAPSGLAADVHAAVVAPLPDGVALMIEESMDDLLEKLLPEPVAAADEAPQDAVSDDERGGGRSENLWDRIRGLTQTEKRLFAVKAARSERALLVQDNDPMVLQSLLKNPHITIDEVIRVSKSSFLTYQIADVIMKTAHWAANLEVRVALIHNPKTPPSLALRILPTLPEAEVKAIARGAATNMPLKQAALRRLQTKT